MSIEPDRVSARSALNGIEAIAFPWMRENTENRVRRAVEAAVSRKGDTIIGDLDVRWFAEGFKDGERFSRPWTEGQRLDGATELVCEASAEVRR